MKYNGIYMILTLMLTACTTSNTPTEMITTGELEVLSSFLEVPYTTNLYANGDLLGETESILPIEAGIYTIQVGNMPSFESFDFPVHEMEDGRLVACAEVDATIIAGESQTLECEASVVFSGEYVCSDNYCSIEDSSNCNDVNDSSKFISVNSQLEVLTPDGSAPLSGLNLEVTGDEFTSDREDISIVTSVINADEFQLTYTDPFASHNISCIKQ